MKENLTKKLDLNTLLHILGYGLIFCVLLFFNKYYVTYPVDDSFDILQFDYTYHGKYITSYLLNIAYGLVPKLFSNIHINTWCQTGGATIYSTLVIIFISTLSSLFFVRNKKNYLYPLIIFFNFILFYFVFLLGNIDYWHYYISSKTLFFYYIFPYTFLFLLINKILDIILNEKPTNKKDIFILSFLTFIIGFSSDIIAIFTLLFLSVLLCFKRKIKNITTSSILITTSTLLCSLYTSSCSVAFQSRFSTEKFFETCSLGFSSFLNFFNNFNITFIYETKQGFCILFLAITFFSILIYYKLIKTNKMYNYINLILLITIILFCYSLFFVGLGYIVAEEPSYIFGRDILIQIKLFLLMLINIEAGFLLKEIKNNKKLLIITLIFLICISFKYTISEINLINNIGIKNYIKEKIHLVQIKENYKKRYIIERIAFWYLYTDKIPIILKDTDCFYVYNDFCRIADYFYFNKYKKEDTYYYQFLDTLEEVIETYYENGGREITEMEIEEADFNKLLDKNWVLYGK